MRTAHLRAGLLATALMVGVAALNGQQPAHKPERGLDLLTVDFNVVSSEGRPVADLQPGDVTLRIGGKLRTIRSLQLVAVASDEQRAAAAPMTPLPEPFGTNAISERGRALVLIVDDDSFRAGREAPLREAVAELISRLSPRDRLSLVTMPYGGVKVPLTTDHARVRSALSKIVGQASGNETGSEIACRTRRTLETLSGYLDNQLGIRETPSAIMFITGGLAAPRRDAVVSMGPGMCELRIELFREVARAAGAARAHFYVIQPVDMMLRPGQPVREAINGGGFIGSDNAMEGIEHLAGATGGKMLHLTGSADGALGRVLKETAAYYVATIEPERADRTGRSQQLEVRVARQGVELRARPHVTFPKPDVAAVRPRNPSPRDMLAVETIFRDLPLRASAYSAPDADGKALRIVTIAEPADAAATLSSLVAALFDRDSKLVSHWTATAEELKRSPVVGAMPAQPGAYRLRVAAIDSTGRAGTADYELDAEIAQTGTLRISSLILGLSREGRFAPRLQFGGEPTAMAYVELYGASPGTRITSLLELATTMNGPALVALPLAIEASGENRYVATGVVPIGTLPPGDYVVRAMVGVEGHPMTRVVRTLRKTK